MVRPYGRRAATATVALALSVLAAAAAGCGESTPEDEQAQILAYDAERPLEASARERPPLNGPSSNPGAYRGGTTVEAEFTTFDGERVPAVLSAPRRLSPPYTCVVFQGGLAFDLELDAATGHQALLRLGYAVLSIQPRYGGSRAVPGVKDAVEAGGDPRLLEAMLRGSVIDLRRALDYLEQSGECKAGIGYVGASFGGMMGALLAGVDDRIAAAALIVTPGDWRRLFDCSEALLPGIEDRKAKVRRALRLLEPLDPAAWVARISPRPLLIVPARDDKIVCPPAARALQRAAREPKEIVWVPGGHNPFIHPIAAPRLGKALIDFLRSAL